MPCALTTDAARPDNGVTLATQTGSAIEMLGEATYADLVAEEAFVDALAVDVLAVSAARPGTRRR
jgi:hypothetical protein